MQGSDSDKRERERLNQSNYYDIYSSEIQDRKQVSFDPNVSALGSDSSSALDKDKEDGSVVNMFEGLQIPKVEAPSPTDYVRKKDDRQVY